ncbi:MAG TPA: hypothetical protein VE596_01425 [Gaiellaceae bacterium]|jgi:hypothetical protein|nr:hypothetical protein [Gaiellaceae bacterium]
MTALARDANEALGAAFRAAIAQPLPFTFRQLRRLVERLARLGETDGRLERLTLRDLEELLELEALGDLPLWIVSAIVDMTVAARQAGRAPEEVFDNVPLDRLADVIDRSVARLGIDDVVALGSFARAVGGEDDVLAALRLRTVRRSLSEGALRVLAAKDIRETIERIAAA